jgi:hypothetical protein
MGSLIALMEETALPVVSDDVMIQAAYLQMRADGVTHKLAEMLALQAPPMSNTDREFLEGTQNQFVGDEKTGDLFKKIANRRGVSVTGKHYVGGLAKFPGDPEAWVGSRGDVKRVLEDRGWGSEGAVNVEPRIKPVKREMQLPKALKGGLKGRLRKKGLGSDILGDG